MKPIIIQNSKIPQYLSWFINIGAITLYPFVISKGEMSEITINHEKIHLKQQAELLILPFYILYIGFWAWGKLRGKDNHTAYLDIPFEREAYANQENTSYLIERERWAWRRYIA